MAEVVTYWKALGPPDDWADMEIRDAQGYKVHSVVEANSAEGWMVRAKWDDYGRPIIVDGLPQLERVTGKFTIERKELK